MGYYKLVLMTLQNEFVEGGKSKGYLDCFLHFWGFVSLVYRFSLVLYFSLALYFSSVLCFSSVFRFSMMPCSLLVLLSELFHFLKI